MLVSEYTKHNRVITSRAFSKIELLHYDRTLRFFFRLIVECTDWKRYVLGRCLKNIEFTVGERCTVKKCSLSRVCVNYIYYIELVSINKLAQLQRYRSLFRGSAKEFLARPKSNLSTLPRCLAGNWRLKTFCLFFFYLILKFEPP